ncbi:MAG TPA: hypothetical protein PKA64_11250, partial [Myxococcota bacterium]|nr:hypothetical protein [Myxococcota bacterium]
YRRLAGGELAWFRLGGFRPGRPMVVWSRLADLAPDGDGVRGWVVAGETPCAPVGGNVSWVTSIGHGLATVALWGSAPTLEQLRLVAPSRHPTTAELTSGLADRLWFPPHAALRDALEAAPDPSRAARLAALAWDGARRR